MEQINKLIDIENLQEYDNITSTNTAIVDFWAPWCGPCRTMSSILKDFNKKRPDVFILKVNVDNHGELAARYNVRSIPTLVLFVNGKLVDTKIGALDSNQLEDWLKQHNAN